MGGWQKKLPSWMYKQNFIGKNKKQDSGRKFGSMEFLTPEKNHLHFWRRNFSLEKKKTKLLLNNSDRNFWRSRARVKKQGINWAEMVNSPTFENYQMQNVQGRDFTDFADFDF